MAEIYKGNDYYESEGENLCEDCFDELQKEEKENHKKVAF